MKHKSPTTSERLLRQWGIALTGGIASGKSEVAGILRNKGFLVIDADELARQVVAPGQPALAAVAKAFAHDGIIGVNGELDRKAMRGLILKDPEARKRLEGILHPAIRDALTVALQEAGLVATPRLFFYEAALIFEKGSEGDFREVWLTDCPPETQKQRLQQIRGLTPAVATSLLASQLPPEAKRHKATKVIHTGGTAEETLRQVESALAALQSSL